MPLNTLGLLAGIAVAQRKGVAPGQVARVALPGAVLPNLALGVVVVDRLAQQEAAAEQAPPPPAIVPASPGVGVIAGSPQPGSGATSRSAPPAPTSASDPLPQPSSRPVVGLAPEPPAPLKVGEVLRADPGNWQNTKTGEPPQYQWFRDKGDGAGPEEIDENATSAEYTIGKEDNNSWLTVQVRYDGVSTTSDPIPVGTPPEATPGGSAQAGSGSAQTESGKAKSG